MDPIDRKFPPSSTRRADVESWSCQAAETLAVAPASRLRRLRGRGLIAGLPSVLDRRKVWLMPTFVSLRLKVDA